MQLSGAHVLVTGASRGIGAQLAEGAAARGAEVTLVARSEGPLRERAHLTGGHALVADLADRTQRSDLVARAEGLADRPVDVLVNCAGLDGLAGLLDIGAEDMARLFEVNLLAPAELCRQAVPGMIARGRGHVVDVASGFSSVVAPGLVPYAASKAGLAHFHAGLRAELRGTRVGTTLVEPGPVRTRMWDDIEQHRLASPAIHRFLRLQLTALVEPRDMAQDVLDAVESGRRHAVLPRRMVPVLALGWLPRRVADLALVGVPRR